MDQTIITLLKTLLFFGAVYVYIILISCLSKYTQYHKNPDSVSLFITDRQKKRLRIAFLVMVSCVFVSLFAAELIRGDGVLGAVLYGLLFSFAFCTVNPLALLFYGFFFFLSWQQEKLLAGKLPPPVRASELRFKRYGSDAVIMSFVILGFSVLCAALSLFFSVWEDDYRIFLFFGLPSFALFFLFFTVVMFFRSDGGTIFDTILINAEGIHLESQRGRDVFIPWDYIYEMKKFYDQSGGGRGPMVLRVKSISGEEITWVAASPEPELFIFDLHPELKLIFDRGHC